MFFVKESFLCRSICNPFSYICWGCFDKEVLLSDESMYFHLLLFIVSSCLLKQLLFKIAERSFIMMNLIAFIAFLCFRYFCQS